VRITPSRSHHSEASVTATGWDRFTGSADRALGETVIPCHDRPGSIASRIAGRGMRRWDARCAIERAQPTRNAGTPRPPDCCADLGAVPAGAAWRLQGLRRSQGPAP